MTTPHILEILAKRVEAASNLDELRAALIAIEEEVESHHVDSADDVEGTIALHLDLDHLPTFGGEPPETIEGVLSWDKDRLLVGGGSFWYLDFVERGEASEKNTMERRAALARKAYAARLNDLYRSLRAHKDGSPPAQPGGINLMEQTIGAYFVMIQAARDQDAGRAIEGEPIDNLVTAFDAWVASLPPGGE
jgi:hypothetical protein